MNTFEEFVKFVKSVAPACSMPPNDSNRWHEVARHITEFPENLVAEQINAAAARDFILGGVARPQISR